ncbi:hypothetical protein LNP25_32385 [Klebsiella variicola subsp. variicola]|nr:hypothetical protein [Klebsiella variicola subsp. variicola]
MITLCIEKRGVQTNMVYHGKQVALTYEIPMAEVVLDFFDRLSLPPVAMRRWIITSNASRPRTWCALTC